MARESWFNSGAGRWLSIVLRALHLGAVAWLPAAWAGAGGAHAAGLAVLGSGAALFAVDLAARRIAALELAGVWVLLKLALVALMVARPAWALPLFFAMVLVSALTSHAPKPVRHWRPGATDAPAGRAAPGRRPPPA